MLKQSSAIPAGGWSRGQDALQASCERCGEHILQTRALGPNRASRNHESRRTKARLAPGHPIDGLSICPIRLRHPAYRPAERSFAAVTGAAVDRRADRIQMQQPAADNVAGLMLRYADVVVVIKPMTATGFK